MDTLFIGNLRVETILGVEEWERSVRQEVRLDLEFAADVRRAAARDDLADAIDYKAISKRLQAFVAESACFLVETLAERCAELLRREFGVPWVRLTLHKPGALRGAETVGVTVERGERPA